MTDNREDTVTDDLAGLPTREKVGYLIYAWDAELPGDRTRDQYLALADDILEVVRDG